MHVNTQPSVATCAFCLCSFLLFVSFLRGGVRVCGWVRIAAMSLQLSEVQLNALCCWVECLLVLTVAGGPFPLLFCHLWAAWRVGSPRWLLSAHPTRWFAHALVGLVVVGLISLFVAPRHSWGVLVCSTATCYIVFLYCVVPLFSPPPPPPS